MSTNAHITITSWGRVLIGGKGAGRPPLQGAAGVGMRRVMDDTLSVSVALSLPSPKLSALVWKRAGGGGTASRVMLATLQARRGVRAACRGGGAGASDTSTSWRVDTIGYRPGSCGRSAIRGGAHGIVFCKSKWTMCHGAPTSHAPRKHVIDTPAADEYTIR